MFSRKVTLLIVSLITLIITIPNTAKSKSVYVIADTVDSNLSAYKVQDANLIWQSNYICKTMTSDSMGAVGLAIDESEYGSILFVTTEFSNEIELVNAKTMEYVDYVTALGATNLAGIVINISKEKIYTVDRWTNHLYSYSWNRATKTLTPDFNYPYYIELEGMESGVPYGAFGIALDEEISRLYVADNTESIKYYDTNDWFKDGEISVSCNVISIAIDVSNQLLYYGSMGSYGDGDPHLYKYNISSQAESSVDVGCSVAGISVDQATHLIYLTTYGDGDYDTQDRLIIYDSNLVKQSWESGDIGNPADVAVGSTAAYKPPFPLVELVKDDNDIDCASPLISEAEHELLGTPYNWLYYNIDCNANGYADTSVFITDYLPVEVDYNSSDPCGQYDPNTHTVTWYIPVMSASYSNTFRIQVGVNYHAKPGHTITNYCEIESDQYCTFTTWTTDICCYGGNIIYVNQDANDPNCYHNGTSWLDAYTDLQEALHTARTCGFNQIWVAEGTYIPIETYSSDISARAISFELIDGVSIYGGFPNTGDPNWFDRDWQTYITTLSGDIRDAGEKSDNSYHVVKCVDVNDAVIDGFIITAGNANGDPVYDEPNCLGGGIYCKDSNSIKVENCIIIENEALVYGGGMYDYNSSSLMIKNSTFNDNKASYGGGIYNKYSSANLINCVFTDNSATAFGCGMYNDQSSPTLINCIFTENKSTSYYSRGGGMYNDQSSPTIIKCTFSGNSVGTWSKGGAIYNTNSSEPNMTNCTFGNNFACDGGAVYNVDSDPNISNCIFVDNNAVQYGGGLYNENSTLNVNNSIFTGNTLNLFVESLGAGIHNYQSLSTIDNCIFSGNISKYGCGMYNYYESYASVVNSIFSGNRAEYFGGGIANSDNSNLTLTNCTVSENWAIYGGGICSWNDVNTNLTNCILWDNEATTVYEEIYNDDATSEISVNFCDIKGGWAGAVKGNIDQDPCFFEVEPDTGSWTANPSYDDSTFQSTLTDDSATWTVNQLAGKFINPDTSQTLQFFIVSNNVNTINVWSNVNSIAGYGDTYYIYDYHLRVESPCIDTGDPNGDYTGQTDIDGEPRVFDGDANGTAIVDMGADEYYWSTADFNSDGLVNFFDYAFFASAWQSDPNDPNYNEDCDLEDNNSIDSKDLARFCEDWLWQTAWAKTFPFAYETMGHSMGRSMAESPGLTQDLFVSVSAKQAQPELTAADIEEIIKWLEQLWLTDDQVRKVISKDEWFEFIEEVIELAKQEIQY